MSFQQQDPHSHYSVILMIAAMGIMAFSLGLAVGRFLQ